MLVAAAQMFAAQGRIAGAVGLACVALGVRANEWVVTALAAHVVLGMAGGLYERSLLYDKLVHLAVSFGLARLAAHALSRHAARERLEPGALLERSVPVLAALALGTLWELFEFAADATGLVFAQRGLADTMLDLGANAVGALLGGSTVWRHAGFASWRRCSPAASRARPPPR
jgi:hypothetical protein